MVNNMTNNPEPETGASNMTNNPDPETGASNAAEVKTAREVELESKVKELTDKVNELIDTNHKLYIRAVGGVGQRDPVDVTNDHLKQFIASHFDYNQLRRN